MSTTIEPTASVTGSPAPSAAASDWSIRFTREAPAAAAASRSARRSTAVALEGTQTVNSMRRPNSERACDMPTNWRIICSAAG